jgi:hypothetical protein
MLIKQCPNIEEYVKYVLQRFVLFAFDITNIKHVNIYILCSIQDMNMFNLNQKVLAVVPYFSKLFKFASAKNTGGVMNRIQLYSIFFLIIPFYFIHHKVMARSVAILIV